VNDLPIETEMAGWRRHGAAWWASGARAKHIMVVNMTDDFSNAPESIAEIRADRAVNGALWTPRDALISLLRDIDRGEIKPDALVICIREQGSEPGKVSTYFRAACPDPHVAYGLLLSAAFKINE